MNNYIYSALLIANDRSLLFHYLRETISSLVISSLRKDQRGPCLIHLSVVHSSQDRPCPSQPFCKKEMDKWKPLKLCVCGCVGVQMSALHQEKALPLPHVAEGRFFSLLMRCLGSTRASRTTLSPISLAMIRLRVYIIPK